MVKGFRWKEAVEAAKALAPAGGHGLPAWPNMTSAEEIKALAEPQELEQPVAEKRFLYERSEVVTKAVKRHFPQRVVLALVQLRPQQVLQRGQKPSEKHRHGETS